MVARSRGLVLVVYYLAAVDGFAVRSSLKHTAAVRRGVPVAASTVVAEKVESTERSHSSSEEEEAAPFLSEEGPLTKTSLLASSLAECYGAFVSGASASLGDKRLVDELVAQFAYSGTFELKKRAGPPELFNGQGAVKRGLGLLLHSSHAVSLTFGEPRWDHANAERPSATTTLTLTTAEAVVVQGEVTFSFSATGRSIEALALDATTTEASAFFGAAFEQGASAVATKEGPQWETFDGRVRQRIWQRADLFAPGETFVKDTLELTTGRLICIVDETVWALYGDKLRRWATSVDVELEPIIAPGNEDEKTMENMLFMLDELKRVDPLRRSEPVLAIGGGVLTDTAGFACALWRRGIPWARLPTTLLGMVDASVGIKVAVNYHRKNGVGHFFSPIHTFIDQAFLPSVTPADIRSGCGEIMKAALVHDASLFDLMEAHGVRLIAKNFVDDTDADAVIKRSVDTMLECIGPDLWEEALLRPMDFGHSFSRTLEASEAFKLRHGEAVAIDCIMSTMVANVQGLVSDADAARVLRLYATLGLPCSIAGITADTYKLAVREIKVHRDGILRAPLPQGIGACAYVDEISDAEVDEAFNRLTNFIDQNPSVLWDPSRSFAAAPH